MNPRSIEQLLVRFLAALFLATTGGCGKFDEFAQSDGVKWKIATREVIDPLTGKTYHDRYQRLKAKKDFGAAILVLPEPIMGPATVQATAGRFSKKTGKEAQVGQIAIALDEQEGAGIAALFAALFVDGAFVFAQSDQGVHGEQFIPGVDSVDLMIDSHELGVDYRFSTDNGLTWADLGSGPALKHEKVHVPSINVGVLEKGLSVGADNFFVPFNGTNAADLSPPQRVALAAARAKAETIAAIGIIDGIRDDETKSKGTARIDAAIAQIDAALMLLDDLPSSGAAQSDLGKARKKLNSARKKLNKGGKLKQGKVDKILDKLDAACCGLLLVAMDHFGPLD